MRAAVVAIGLICLASTGSPKGRAQLEPLSDLPGWQGDTAANPCAFRQSRSALQAPDQAKSRDIADRGITAAPPCTAFLRAAMTAADAPRRVTGCCECEVSPSRLDRPEFELPLRFPPPELPETGLSLTGQEIQLRGAVAGRGLDIARGSDSLAAFDHWVQRPESLPLRGGTVMRVGDAGSNGDAYRSVREKPAGRATHAPHQVRAEVSRRRPARDPGDGEKPSRHNRPQTLFRVSDDHLASRRPLGVMNRMVTPARSAPVDPDHVPPGAAVWLAPGG